MPTDNGCLSEREHKPICYSQLLYNNIHPGCDLSHRMFYLEPCVDFQEGDSPVLREKKLYGASSDIPRMSTNSSCGIMNRLALLQSDKWGRCLFDQLLIAPL
ncbi:hypothetical protein D3C73_1154630 [compost metagenome]